MKTHHRLLASLLGIAALAAAVFVVVPTLWDGTNSYVDRNEDLLRELPVYPGARHLHTSSNPYRLSESGPVAGYGTLATYEAPDTDVESLLSFFEANLPDEWTVWRDEIPCRDIATGRACPSQFFLRATRGSAYVSVDPSNIGTRLGSYDVYVDHDSHLAEPTPPTMPPPASTRATR